MSEHSNLNFYCVSLPSGDIYKDDSLVKAKINVEVANIDDNSVESTDPQFSATIESEIYDNLRASEVCHLFPK